MKSIVTTANEMRSVEDLLEIETEEERHSSIKREEEETYILE